MYEIERLNYSSELQLLVVNKVDFKLLHEKELPYFLLNAENLNYSV